MSAISGIGGGYRLNDLYGKIASGNRIQRAADDAAGLNISTKMETQRRTQNQQSRNAASQRDAIAVADGGRSGITGYLQDINELSVRAANGTMSDSDRQAIQNQINQYASGIDDVVRQTKYNESYVLSDGSSTSKGLGLSGYDVRKENFDLDAVSSSISQVASQRSKDGASYNGLSANISNLDNESENTTAGLSRIGDLDVAGASTALKTQQALEKYQISMQKRQLDDQRSFMNRMFA